MRAAVARRGGEQFPMSTGATRLGTGSGRVGQWARAAVGARLLVRWHGRHDSRWLTVPSVWHIPSNISIQKLNTRISEELADGNFLQMCIV